MAEQVNVAVPVGGPTGPIQGGSGIPGSGVSRPSFAPGRLKPVVSKKSDTEARDVEGLFGSASNAILNNNEPGPANALAHFNFNSKYDPASDARQASIQSMFNRPFFLDTIPWSVIDVQGFVLNNFEFPSVLKGDKMSSSGIMRFHKNFRSGISFQVLVNPTPFQQGALWVVWFPGTCTSTFFNFGNVGVLPHAVINLGVSNSATVHVPWHYWRRWLDTTVPDSVMGTLSIIVLNPLQSGTTDSQTLEVAAWVQLTNPQIDGMLLDHNQFETIVLPSIPHMEQLDDDDAPEADREDIVDLPGDGDENHISMDEELALMLADESDDEDFEADRELPVWTPFINEYDVPEECVGGCPEVTPEVEELVLQTMLLRVDDTERVSINNAMTVDPSVDGELASIVNQLDDDALDRMQQFDSVFTRRHENGLRSVHYPTVRQRVGAKWLNAEQCEMAETLDMDYIMLEMNTDVYSESEMFWVQCDEDPVLSERPRYYPSDASLVEIDGKFTPTYRMAFVRHYEEFGILAVMMHHVTPLDEILKLMRWLVKYVVYECAESVPNQVTVYQGDGDEMEAWEVTIFMERGGYGQVMHEVGRTGSFDVVVAEVYLHFRPLPKQRLHDGRYVICAYDKGFYDVAHMNDEQHYMVVNGAMCPVREMTINPNPVDGMNDYLRAANGERLDPERDVDEQRAAGDFDTEEGPRRQYALLYEDFYDDEAYVSDSDDEPSIPHMEATRKITDMAPAGFAVVPSLGFVGDDTPQDTNSTGCVPTETWDYHLSCESLFSTLNWQVISPVGTVLDAFGVSPMFETWNGYHGQHWVQGECTTNLGGIASMYAYWRGSIDIMIQPIITRMHRGRLLMTYIVGDAPIPAAGAVLNLGSYASSYTWSFDIGDTSMYVCSVPYISTTEWTPTPMYNGVFIISIQTGLSARQETPQTVAVNLWMRAGEDFDLTVPTARYFVQGNQEMLPSFPQMEKLEEGTEVEIPKTEHFAIEKPLANTRMTKQPVGPTSLTARFHRLSSGNLAPGAFTSYAVNPVQLRNIPGDSVPNLVTAAGSLFAFATGGINVRIVTSSTFTQGTVFNVDMGLGDPFGTNVSASNGRLVVHTANQPTFEFHIPFYSLNGAVPQTPDVPWELTAPFFTIQNDVISTHACEFQVYIQIAADFKYYFPIPVRNRLGSMTTPGQFGRYWSWPLARDLGRPNLYNGLKNWTRPIVPPPLVELPSAVVTRKLYTVSEPHMEKLCDAMKGDWSKEYLAEFDKPVITADDFLCLSDTKKHEDSEGTEDDENDRSLTLPNLYIPTKHDLMHMDETMMRETITQMSAIIKSTTADDIDGPREALDDIEKTIKAVSDAANTVKSTVKSTDKVMKQVSSSLVDLMANIKDFFTKDTPSMGLAVIIVKTLIYGAQAYRARGTDLALIATQFIIDAVAYVPTIRKYLSMIVKYFCKTKDDKSNPKKMKPSKPHGFFDFIPSMAVEIVESAVGTIPDKKGFLDQCKDFSILATAGKNLQWFFEQLYNVIKKLVDWVRGTKPAGQYWKDHADDMSDFVVACEEMLQIPVLNVQRDVNKRARLQELHEIAVSIQAASCYHIAAPAHLLHTARIISARHTDVNKIADGARRTEPICIYLAGKAGVGKTLLMDEISQAFSVKHKIERKRAAWTCNASCKHFDGYAQQPIVCLDDVGQDTTGDDWKNLMQMVGSAQFIPPMADLKEKGTIFTSEMVICSSNQTRPMPVSTLTDMPALHRRLQIPLLVEVKPDFQDENGRLNFVKAKKLNFKSDKIWKLSRYDMGRTDLKPIEIPLTKFLESVMLEHESRFEVPLIDIGLPHGDEQHGDDCQTCLKKVTFAIPKTTNLVDLWDSNPLSHRDTPFWRRVRDVIVNAYNVVVNPVVIRTLSFISMVLGLVTTLWMLYKTWYAEVEEDVEEVKKDAGKVQGAVAKGGVVSASDSSKLQGDVDKLQNDVSKGIVVNVHVDPATPNGLYTEQQRKKKKARIVNEPHAEMDLTFVLKNMVRVTAHSKSARFRVYGLGLMGQWLIIPLHITRLLDLEYLEIKFDDERVAPFVVMAKYIDGYVQPPAHGTDHSDIFLMKLTGCPKNFRNITSRIMTGEIHHSRMPGVLVTPDQHDGNVRTCANVRARIYQQYVSEYGKTDRVASVKGFTYEGNVRMGMCGAPLLSLVVQHGNFPILGIHTAGNREGTRGETQILDKSWLEQMITSVKPVAQPHMLKENVKLIADDLHSLYVNTKTAYQKGVLYGLYPDERQPAVLSPDDDRLQVEWDWDQIFTGKFRDNTASKPVNFDRAVEFLSEQLLLSFEVEKYQKYDLKKAICGTKASLNPINMQTSAGYPWCKLGVKKTDLLTYSGLDDWEKADYWVSPALEKQMRDIIGGGSVLWVSAMKDELRPLYKIEQGKTRTIDTPPLAFTVLFRQHFGHFCDLYTQNFGVQTHHAIGCDIDAHMTAFWNDLTDVSNYGFDCDFSCYDGSVPAWALSGAMRVMSGCRDGQEPTPEQVLLFQSVMYSKHHYLKKVVQTTGGVPSGTPATSILNSVVHTLLAMTAWLDLNPEERPLSQMKEEVAFLVYGDDGVFAVNNNWYTPIALQAWYSDIGMVFTPAEKSDECDEFVPISNLSFLKRKARFEAGIAHPCIDVGTIHSLANWQRKSADFEMLMEDLLGFAYHYGRPIFRKYRNEIYARIKDFGLTTELPDFEFFERRFLGLHGRMTFGLQ